MGIWHCLFIYIAVLSRNKMQFTPKGREVISILETVEENTTESHKMEKWKSI